MRERTGIIGMALALSLGWVGTMPGRAEAQAAPKAGRLEFDVVSVRQSKPGEENDMHINIPFGGDDAYRNTGGVFSAQNIPVRRLISFAYKLTTSQGETFRASLPDWAATDTFTIEARTENHEVTKDQMRMMIRSLLDDRFKLKVHYENRQVPVYAVELIKPGVLGPQLRQHAGTEPCSKIAAPQGRPDPDAAPRANPYDTVPGGFPTLCGGYINMPPSGPGLRHEGARDMAMSMILGSFSGMGNLGRPVVDQTGLTGTYDFVMEFLDQRPGIDVPVDASGPTFQDALKSQMGLKLVPQKAEYEFLIVDHVEHPTVN